MWKICVLLVLTIAGCGSNVERVQSIGSDKADYRRSPCACYQLRLMMPKGDDAFRRNLAIERALG